MAAILPQEVLPVISGYDERHVNVIPGPLFQFGYASEPELMTDEETLLRCQVEEELVGGHIRFTNIRPQEDNPTFANAYLDRNFGLAPTQEAIQEKLLPVATEEDIFEAEENKNVEAR
jgi:hypothetical protein